MSVDRAMSVTHLPYPCRVTRVQNHSIAPRFKTKQSTIIMSISTILLVFSLIIVLIGALPAWPYSGATGAIMYPVAGSWVLLLIRTGNPHPPGKSMNSTLAKKECTACDGGTPVLKVQSTPTIKKKNSCAMAVGGSSTSKVWSASSNFRIFRHALNSPTVSAESRKTRGIIPIFI